MTLTEDGISIIVNDLQSRNEPVDINSIEDGKSKFIIDEQSKKQYFEM